MEFHSKSCKEKYFIHGYILFIYKYFIIEGAEVR